MKAAKRVTKSLTSDWETANLPRLAASLPAWVTPDHLTGLGIVAAFIIGLGYVMAHRSPAWLLLTIFGLALHWFGDSLDGTLARVRRSNASATATTSIAQPMRSRSSSSARRSVYRRTSASPSR